MAHMIYGAEKGARASVFVVGKPAWHKLGKLLDNPATAEEAIIAGGLDWEVQKQPMYLQDGTRVPNRYANVRMDTNTPLGVVGERYTVLQNREAFKFFDGVVDAGEAIYHSAGVLGQGERVWIMAKLPEYIRIKGIDDVEVYVTMLLGHDGKTVVMAFVHLNRIVCNNTLQVALREGKRLNKLVKFAHRSGIVENVTNGAELLGIVNQYRNDMNEVFSSMANQRVDDEYTKAFVSALFPAIPDEVAAQMKRTPSFQVYRGKVLEAIENGAGQDMPTAKGTKFGLFNGVTFWLDNVRNGYGSDSKKQQSIWFGDSARVRQRAFDLLNLDADILRDLEYATVNA